MKKPPHWYPAQVAEEKAAALQVADPEWTYTVRYSGNGWAYIEVRDEDGYLLDLGAFFGP